MLRDKKPKTKEIIRCPYCNERLEIDTLLENGYIEKMANVTIYTCSKCLEEFQG